MALKQVKLCWKSDTLEIVQEPEILFYSQNDLCMNQNLTLLWLVCFNGISTIVVFLMLNPLYKYILDIYDSLWFAFMTYQSLII